MTEKTQAAAKAEAEKKKEPPKPTKEAASMLKRLEEMKPKRKEFTAAHREKVQLHRLLVGSRNSKRGNKAFVRGRPVDALKAAVAQNAKELEMDVPAYEEMYAAVLFGL